MAHRREEGRLGLIGLLGLALCGHRGGARHVLLVEGDLQAAGQLVLLIGERDIVVLPAMDIAHIGHQMRDIGATGDADQFVEGIDRDQQHEQQRHRGGERKGIEGRRMR